MPQRTNKRRIGGIGESAVADFLAANGYEVLERNYTIRGGEIDIIARKNGVLCFVEVKTRKVGAMVPGEAAVTMKKRRFIVRTAERYHREYVKRFGETKCRFDVASVVLENGRIKHVKYYVAAFNASGNS